MAKDLPRQMFLGGAKLEESFDMFKAMRSVQGRYSQPLELGRAVNKDSWEIPTDSRTRKASLK